MKATIITLLLLLPLIFTSTSSSSDPVAPPPTAGGEVPSSPATRAHGWNSWVSTSPSSGAPAPVTSPLVPREGRSSPPPTGAPKEKNGIPFLTSNPAIPLPTGITDTATIKPLSTPGDGDGGNSDGTQVAGIGGSSSVGSGRWLVVLAILFSLCGLWL